MGAAGLPHRQPSLRPFRKRVPATLSVLSAAGVAPTVRLPASPE